MLQLVDPSLVQVDAHACEQLATALEARSIPEDREEIHFEGFESSELENLLLLVVAVCHQTSARGERPLAGKVNGRLLKGWDYLLQRFVEAARSDKSLVQPSFWEELSPMVLRSLYRNSDGQDLLTDVNNRAHLINDLGHVMKTRGWASAAVIYRQCNGRISTGKPNLIESLAQFRAYRDPVCKKSFFFLSLMRNTGLWNYEDSHLLGAPVDYHEVRGHLRIGTVTVTDETLKSKLLKHEPVTAHEDIAIRAAVLQAIMLISEKTGLNNPSQLHYLFWNVFRNYCTREDPNCLGDRRETYLPDRYQALSIPNDNKMACPFSGVCGSVLSTERYYEHLFETDYY